MTRWVGVLVVVVAIAACTPARTGDVGDPVPSNPPGPDLAGRILAFDHGARPGEGRVVEIRDGAAATTLVDGVIAADLSPDGRQLAYVGKDSTLVWRDLESDTDTAIPVTVPASPECLSWSPDGRRLGFLGRADRALYVTTVDGESTRVDVPKQQLYVETAEGYLLPQAQPGGASVNLISEVTCGRWLDDRRLVFDRVADMPATVTLDEEEPSQQVPADTTTVALLDPVQLVDSPEQWRLEDRCGDHVLTFVDDGDRSGRYVLEPATVGDDQLDQAAWRAPGDGALPSARAAFIDGTCDVLLLLGDSSAWHPTSRYDVDTGETEDLQPTFDDDHNPPLLDPDTVAFNQEGTSWAVADQETLYVFNLGTGGSTLVSSAGLVSKVLGWLPS